MKGHHNGAALRVVAEPDQVGVQPVSIPLVVGVGVELMREDRLLDHLEPEGPVRIDELDKSLPEYDHVIWIHSGSPPIGAEGVVGVDPCLVVVVLIDVVEGIYQPREN